MIFCDGCNVCVHQACYGVQELPTGAWLCCPCGKSSELDTQSSPSHWLHALALESTTPSTCFLCGYGGGALKELSASIFQRGTRLRHVLASAGVALWPSIGGVSSLGGGVSSLAGGVTMKEKASIAPHLCWVHVVCVLWIPECRFDDAFTMENVVLLEDIPVLYALFSSIFLMLFIFIVPENRDLNNRAK